MAVAVGVARPGPVVVPAVPRAAVEVAVSPVVVVPVAAAGVAVSPVVVVPVAAAGVAVSPVVAVPVAAAGRAVSRAEVVPVVVPAVVPDWPAAAGPVPSSGPGARRSAVAARS